MTLTPLNDLQDVKLDPQLEYRALVRSLKYTQGFGLLFIQCSPVEGERLIIKVKEDLPQKKIEVLTLTEVIDNLYDKVYSISYNTPIDVLFVQGIEHSLYYYENNRIWINNAQRRSYSETGVPRLLQHLNLSRERFRENFSFHFVFLVTNFALKYLARRAPDFFDWNSGVLEFTRYNDWDSEKKIEDIRRKARSLKTGVGWEILEEVMAHRSHQLDKDKASYNRDTILSNMKQYEAILTSYETVLGRKLDKSEAWLKRGIGLSNLRKYEEAVSSYEKAFEFKPDNQILYEQSIALSKLGRNKEAVSIYYKILEFRQNQSKVLNNLGSALNNLGAYEEAVANFDKAIQLNPNDSLAWYNRGIALRKLGRYEEVIICFDKTLEFSPEDYQAWNNRGIALFNLGRYEEAIASYDKAIQFKLDGNSAWYNRSTALFNLGRYEEAIAGYNKVLQFSPDNPNIFYSMSRCHALQSNPKAAVENLSRAIKLNPDLYRDMAKNDSDFDSIRENEHFKALVDG